MFVGITEIIYKEMITLNIKRREIWLRIKFTKNFMTCLLRVFRTFIALRNNTLNGVKLRKFLTGCGLQSRDFFSSEMAQRPLLCRKNTTYKSSLTSETPLT